MMAAKNTKTTGTMTLEAELEARAFILRCQCEDAGICQDDYEWATMTGDYASDRTRYISAAAKLALAAQLIEDAAAKIEADWLRYSNCGGNDADRGW